MSILAIGDLHIQPDNLSDINVFLSQLEKWLSQNFVDLIVILGDTLHTHETVYTECLNKMLEYIRICEKYAQTEILVGNHDYINNQQFLTNAHPFSGWKKTHNIVDYVKSIKIREFKIILCPFVPDGRFHEALRTCQEDWKDANCIFAHQLLDGAKMGAILTSGIEKWDEHSPMLICGHIHDKQLVQKNLWYTGSSMQVSFGEHSDHTISLVNINSNELLPQITEVNIYPPTKKTVYSDISEIKNITLPQEENVKTKLSLSGDAEEFRTFKKSNEYKELIQKGVKVVFKQKKSYNIHLPKTSLKSFPEILFSLIGENFEMIKLYSQVLNYSSPNATEIIFEEEN